MPAPARQDVSPSGCTSSLPSRSETVAVADSGRVGTGRAAARQHAPGAQLPACPSPSPPPHTFSPRLTYRIRKRW